MISIFVVLPLAGQDRWTVLTSGDGIAESRVRCIRELPDGRVAIATTAAIDIYDGTRFHASTVNPRMAYPLPEYHAYRRLDVDKGGHLWLRNRGTLHIFNINGEACNADSILHSIGWDGGTVTAVFIDNGNSGTKRTRYWLVSKDGDLHLCENRQCTRVLSLTLSGCGVPEEIVSSGKQVFLCYASNKVCELSMLQHTAAAGKKTDYTGTLVFCGSPETEVPSAQLRNGINVMLHGGCLWMTVNYHNERRAYVERLDITTHEWRPSMVVPMRISNLEKSPGGEIITVGNRGFYVLNSNNQIMEHQRELPADDDGVAQQVSDDLSCILFDRYGGKWIGTTESGLLYCNPRRYNLIRSVSERYPHKPMPAFCSERARQQAKIHADGTTNCSAEATDGLLYLGTREGLTVINAGGRVVTRINEKDGLGSNNVQAVLVRSANDIWIATTTGISNLRKRGGGSYDLTHYGKLDGMNLGGRELHPCEMCMTDSLVYVGFGSGMYVFCPDSLVASKRYVFHHLPVNETERNGNGGTVWWLAVAGFAITGLVAAAYRRLTARKKASPETEKPCHGNAAGKVTDKECTEFATRLQDIVTAHMADEDFSVQALATEMAMDRTVLFRRMQTLMNTSPSIYIRNVRMNAARCLLEEEGLAPADVAGRTGFSSVKYFTRIFKETFGVLPRDVKTDNT